MKDKLFCGIAYNVHDSSVSFAINRKVVLVLEAERFFREKKKGCNEKEMECLINHGLKILNKKPDDISNYALSTLKNPLIPRDYKYDFSKRRPREQHWKKVKILGKKRNAFIVNHHLCHAATYLLSPFKRAIIITCDGGGDYDPFTKQGECHTVYTGNENSLKRQELNLGTIVTGKTYRTCSIFAYNDEFCEGKLMALAAFGEIRRNYLQRLENLYPKLETVDYNLGYELLEKAFPGLRGTASNPNKETKDFCASTQEFFVNHRKEDTKKIVKQIGARYDNLVMGGGTYLNLDLNTAIWNEFPNMGKFITPCCDDTGQSLGALALLISEIYKQRPVISLPYLGEGNPNFSYSRETLKKVVDVLLHDGIALIHNGQSEIGPRALGNRSFVARPDSIKVKRKLSEEIKQRAKYRPVAPAVIIEKVNEYFIGPPSSPFMLYKYKSKKSIKNDIIGGLHHDTVLEYRQ